MANGIWSLSQYHSSTEYSEAIKILRPPFSNVTNVLENYFAQPIMKEIGKGKPPTIQVRSCLGDHSQLCWIKWCLTGLFATLLWGGGSIGSIT